MQAAQPVIFFGHGSPMNALQENKCTEQWREIVAGLPRPKAILAISAHWETEGGTFVTSNAKPKTIHDFGGFPKALFDMQYPAPGSADLVNRVIQLLPGCKPSAEWGLDHGTWSVLVKTHPQADIPVVQLSMDVNLTFQQHYDLAKRLAPLRDENILIIGSGNILHNLYGITQSEAPLTLEFLNTMRKALQTSDHKTIINAPNLRGWKESSPSDEHFLPLIYCIALQRQTDKVSFYNNDYTGSFTMLCVKYSS